MPKRIQPLTAVQIRTAKPLPKETKLFDGGGLYLLVTPSGGKLWRLKYTFANKEKKLAFGGYPEVSLAQAREERRKARELLAQGIDPAEAKQEEQRVQETFEDVAREWLLEHAVNWEQGSSRKIMTHLEKDVFPWVGNRPIAEITPPELLVVLKRVVDRGAAYTASRIKIICGQIFRYAVATGRVERDPTADLKGALAPVKTTHRAALTEPKLIAPILRMIDGYDGSPVVCAALRLMPLLFVRPGELRSMLWEDVDLKKGEWAYLVNKTKTSRHLAGSCGQVL
jgi:hypothetical protein